MEEVQGVGLQCLTQVHQAAQFLRGRCELIDADELVDCLGGSQMVADRTDAAEALHEHRQLPVGPALDEALEATEFDDMQPRLLDAVLLVHQQCDLAVALDARDRIDHDAAKILRVLRGFKMFVHGGIPDSGSGAPPALQLLSHLVGECGSDVKWVEVDSEFRTAPGRSRQPGTPIAKGPNKNV